MPFSNPILGGTALVRPAIHSPNYNPGTSGWSINADGSAEFTDLTIDGSALSQIKIAFTDGSYEQLYAGTYQTSTGPATGTWIALQPHTQAGSAWNPGSIGTQVRTDDTTRSAVVLTSPWNSNTPLDSQVNVLLVNRGDNAGGLGSQFMVFADSTQIAGVACNIFANFQAIDAFASDPSELIMINGQLLTHGRLTIGLAGTLNVGSSASWQSIGSTYATPAWANGQMTASSGVITLPQTGVWEVHHRAEFPNNGTGLRGGRIQLGGTSSGTVQTHTPVPTTGFGTQAHETYRAHYPAGTTIQHQIFQNSGSTLNSVAVELQATLTDADHI